jgi:hypothetical protein
MPAKSVAVAHVEAETFAQMREDSIVVSQPVCSSEFLECCLSEYVALDHGMFLQFVSKRTKDLVSRDSL